MSTLTSVNITMTLAVDEELSNTNLLSDAKVVKHGSTRKTSKTGLTPNSAQPCTRVYDADVALTAGAATIDFTSLTGTEGAFSAVGLKLQSLWIRNKATNANAMTIAKGASNGYTGLGSAFSHTLQPGQSMMFDGNEAGPDVASGDKTLDVSGTAAQVLEVVAVFG